MRRLGLFSALVAGLLLVQVRSYQVAPSDVVDNGDHNVKPVLVRPKRHSGPYSPYVFFPAYYYAQPWLRPQYVEPTVQPAATYVRVRRSTIRPTQRQQRYSIWDLSRRRKRSIDRAEQRRQKRQIDFYDGGNLITAGYSVGDRRPLRSGQSPGIEPFYYSSNNPHSVWDLSRRRRRRRRQVQTIIDNPNGLAADSSADGRLAGIRQSDSDRPPKYTIWDLVRRRKRDVAHMRTRPLASVSPQAV